MNIKELEKSFFENRTPPKNKKTRAKWEEVNQIMTKHYDSLKLDAINKATDQILYVTIKNGIIFNRVNQLEATKDNLASKRVVYSDYKKFIGALCGLPQVEKEFVVEKLKQNYTKCAKQYAIFVGILDFEEAKQYKIVGDSIKTALKSIEGKNKFLELVK
jgi:hypothetical protein